MRGIWTLWLRRLKASPPRRAARFRVEPLEDRWTPAAELGEGTAALLLNPDNTVRQTILAYDPSFTGGIWVSRGDVNGDGVPDLITAPGPGQVPQVKVFDGQSGDLIRDFLAYEPSFIGGVYAVAADLNGDGKAEVITSTNVGGGPRVRVFDGASITSDSADDPTVVANFLAIDDPNFRGGARVAVGDIDHDGVPDVVVAAGLGGGPRIAGFDGRVLGLGQPVKLFPDFFAFEPSVRNGAYVAVGDVNGDGYGDFVFGGGPGGGPRVRVVNGKGVLAAGAFDSLDARPALTLNDFYVGDGRDRNGIRVGVTPAGEVLAVGVVTGYYTVPIYDALTGEQTGSLYRNVAVNGGLFNDLSVTLPNTPSPPPSSPPTSPQPVSPPPASPPVSPPDSPPPVSPPVSPPPASPPPVSPPVSPPFPPPVPPPPMSPPPAGNTPPLISDVVSQVAVAGVPLGPISFAVGDAETPAANLLVSVVSSDSSVVPMTGLVLGGGGSLRTLTITPAAGASGSAMVTLTVRDGAGATASDSFSVIVTPPPPPPPPGSPPPVDGGPGTPPDDGGDGGTTSPGTPDNPNEPGLIKVAPIPAINGAQDYFFVNDGAQFTLTMQNAGIAPQPGNPDFVNGPLTPMIVTLQVDGPASEFLDGVTGSTYTFSILPEQQQSFQVDVKNLLANIQTVTVDRLYGAKFHLTAAASYEPQNLLFDQTFYVYRFLDVADADHGDGVASMADTAVDGSGGVTRNRPLELHTGGATPTFSVADTADFAASASGFTFDPRTVAALSTPVTVFDPAGNVAGGITIAGDGVKQQWYVDQAAFLNVLSQLATGALAGASAAEQAMIGTPATRQAVVSAVMAKTQALLSDVSAGWTLVSTPTATSTNINVFNSADAAGGIPADALGVAYLIDNESNGGIMNLVAQRAAFNAAEQDYRLSTILNQIPQGHIDVYVDRFFAGLDLSTVGLSGLENTLAKTFAHELAHNFGLIHTSDVIPGSGGNQDTAAENDLPVGDPATDIMAQGFDTTGTDHFTITANALKVALGVNWSDIEAQQALDYFTTYGALDGGFSDNDEGGSTITMNNGGLPVGAGAGLIIDPATGAAVSSVDFGTALADGVGGVSAVRNLRLVNLGDHPLTLTNITLVGTGFRLTTAISANATIDPGGSLDFQIVFDPSVGGPAAGKLTFTTDGIVTALPVALAGVGQVSGGDVLFTMANNNLGGVTVGESASGVAVIANQGSGPLTITSISAGPGYTVSGLPADFGPNHPIILQPGQSFTVNITFTPTAAGLLPGAIVITSDDPTSPTYKAAVTGTGLPTTGLAPHWGSDYILVTAAGRSPTRFQSDAMGRFYVNLPPNTPYTLSVYDPVSGLIWTTAGVSAGVGQSTNLGTPVFRPSTAADSNGDGVPDDIGAILGMQ